VYKKNIKMIEYIYFFKIFLYDFNMNILELYEYFFILLDLH
jgi:hypothetical protein